MASINYTNILDSSIATGAKGGAEAATEAQKAALAKYLQAQEPDIAGQKQTAQNQANLNTLSNPQFQKLLNQGGSARVADLSAGGDPYAHAAQANMKGEASAIAQAQKTYNAGLPKIQQVGSAAAEGLEASNDPSNMGSLGQARTLMLKAMGMNRYNEQEAKAVLPQSLQGLASNIFNMAGGDETPLNEAQRKNINQFFRGQLQSAQQQHESLKQNSLNVAMSSPFATPNTAVHLQGLGSAADNMFKQAQEKYSGVPATQGANLTAQPNPSVLDRLKGLFSPSPKTQAAATPNQTQETDPIAAELAKRAKGALNTPQQNPPQQGQ